MTSNDDDLSDLDPDAVSVFRATFDQAVAAAQGDTPIDRGFDALERWTGLAHAAGIPPACGRWECDYSETCPVCWPAIMELGGEFLTASGATTADLDSWIDQHRPE